MRASAERLNNRTTIVILLFLMAGGYLFRTVFAESVMIPPARMQGETTQAYRYTSMISSGEGVPAVDSLVMSPGGMRTGENSIFEEYIAGGIHRITGGDLKKFLTFFCRFFPLLLMPVICFWMSRKGFSLLESLFGAVLYAVILPALLRTRGESFYRETVALPLLFSALSLADLSSDRKGRNALMFSVAGALMLLFSLAAWKVTAFISLGLFLWLIFTGADKRTVIPFAAAQISASLLFSHMRHDGAIFSPSTVMAVVSLLYVFFRSRWVKWAGPAASAISAVLFSSGSTSHVGSVITAKFRFLFSHPEDPMLLSPDARLFWVSGYTSPSPAQIILLFSLALIAALFGFKTFRKRAGNSLLFWSLPVSLAGYLLFDRLHVLLAAAVVPVIIASLRGKKYLMPAVILLFGAQSMLAPELAGSLSEAGLELRSSASLLGDRELDDLLDWAGEQQGTVLCYWHLSGLLSAYSSTPVVTHTFFENTENRRTIQEYAERIYGSEAEMVAFMEEKEAVFLIYQADFIFDLSSQGLLYLAGLTQVPDGSLAVRLHYYPESLERLVPVWQGPSLRVFKLDGTPESLERHVLWERRYGSFINTAETAFSTVVAPVETGLYFANEGILNSDPDRLSSALLLFASSPEEVPADVSVEMLQRVITEYLSGNYDMEYLALDFETYLDAWGPDPQARLDLVHLLRAEGMNSRAEYHIQILEDMGRQ